MNKITSVIHTLILGIIFFSVSSVQAFEVGGTRTTCREPKFRNFIPPEREKDGPISEAEPESEISFNISGDINPDTVKVHIKRKQVDANVINKNSFFHVIAKIPPELSGKFARIDIRATHKDGECHGEDGWLIKVKPAGEKVAPAAKQIDQAIEKTEVVEKVVEQ